MAVIDFGRQEKKDRHLPQLANMFGTEIMQRFCYTTWTSQYEKRQKKKKYNPEC